MECFTVKDFCEIQDTLNQQMTAFQLEPWYEYLLHEEIKTQIRVELSEALMQTNATYKWWKSPKDQFDPFDVKMEIIDALHFYLAKWLQEHYRRGGTLMEVSTVPVDAANVCFSMFSPFSNRMYSDRGVIDHEKYNYLCECMINRFDIYDMFDTVCAVGGMTPSELAAIYYAKSTLNEIRCSAGMKQGLYVNKPSKGVEDSKRLKYIIEAFNQENGLDLEQVRETTFGEFFEVIDNGKKENRQKA